jgi:hypothetical protein
LQAAGVQRIVVLDNASIHEAKPMDQRQQKWMAQRRLQN